MSGPKRKTAGKKRGTTARAAGARKSAQRAARHATFARAAASRLRAATSADDLRPVTFSTGSNNHFVGITAGLISGSGPNTISLMLPSGDYPIHWRVTGTGPFTLTADGATLATPIASEAPDAGVVGISVV